MPVKGETKPVPALVEGSRSLLPLPQRSATFDSLTALTPKGKMTHMVPLHLSGGHMGPTVRVPLLHSWNCLAISTTFNYGVEVPKT